MPRFDTWRAIIIGFNPRKQQDWYIQSANIWDCAWLIHATNGACWWTKREKKSIVYTIWMSKNYYFNSFSLLLLLWIIFLFKKHHHHHHRHHHCFCLRVHGCLPKIMKRSNHTNFGLIRMQVYNVHKEDWVVSNHKQKKIHINFMRTFHKIPKKVRFKTTNNCAAVYLVLLNFKWLLVVIYILRLYTYKKLLDFGTAAAAISRSQCEGVRLPSFAWELTPFWWPEIWNFVSNLLSVRQIF